MGDGCLGAFCLISDVFLVILFCFFILFMLFLGYYLHNCIVFEFYGAFFGLYGGVFELPCAFFELYGGVFELPYVFFELYGAFFELAYLFFEPNRAVFFVYLALIVYAFFKIF